MKKLTILLIFLPVFLMASYPKQDTLFISSMSGTDTTIWISLAYINFGSAIAIEYNYEKIDTLDGYIKPCSRRISGGLPVYYNVGALSSDTSYNLIIDLGVARFENDMFLGEQFGFYFNKGTETNDTLIYNYRKQ